MSLLVKGRSDGREIVAVTPRSAGWKYVGFAAYRLNPGESIAVQQPQDELCFVVLAGTVTVKWRDQTWREIGGPWVISDRVMRLTPQTVVYLPKLKPTVIGRKFHRLEPSEATVVYRVPTMKRFSRGKELNERFVCDILPQTEPASHLLVVEVRTPSGHSSSYPPHKHDVDNLPQESALEETYYHRLQPAQGFAFQRVYTDDRSLDESLAVEDHDVVLVPRGYHPVVVPFGYESYYLNVMAGPRREWHFKNDPAHEWMLKV